jgi:glycosyltransferase involved in cell wall biosynthesis
LKGNVFIGVNNIAGVGTNLLEGFLENGIKAGFYSAEKTFHPYNYPDGTIPERIPHSATRWISKIKLVFFLMKILFRYKYFIFLQAGWTLMKNERDIRLLRFFGKKTMVILTGCDARVPEKVEQFRWNPCSACPDEYKQFVNCRIPFKTLSIPELQNTFNFVCSADECAGLLSKTYTTIYFPRVTANFIAAYPAIKKNDRIRILHAPSNTHYKGTKYVRAAIERLKQKYTNIEYVEAQDLPLNELYELIKTCHLVIDQMIGGFYGLLAVESMALGKPVVAYIRPDILEKISNDCPVINADPDTLETVLEKIILNPEALTVIGKTSRRYVERFHDSKKVAGDLYRVLTGNKG